ncbi:MAG: bifunctional (p)ppGpp synthetase/guanosine-3',5'-bis(diphosphate) 3'-pyrophosphohydrolase [Minwuia sp.]|nr:bifunctional (p)ppGpp synthetase/guanosine-3',5'-bis(diphosphate) 3'-pyrophosphohydrolase [Minwuia sp.]
MMRQMQLVERVLSYDPKAREDLINKAYVFAVRAHGSQKRASGDPYFSHPVEVAGILTDYRLDTETIVTALLHDTIEDTLATPEQIEREFGPHVAQLVDGVTKLSKMELKSDETQQAENFRKLLLAMSDDIRVLVVKLADRLHNMRTIKYLKPEKARRIALETREIYAPLAERVGMNDIKEELLDLSFQVLDAKAWSSIDQRLEMLRAQAGNLVVRMQLALQETVRGTGLIAEISGREKRHFSIWRKLQAKRITFEQLADVYAFRIIVDNADACYRMLGAIHQRYPMVPDQFDDYISIPKRNGYQSLHTVVLGPEGVRTEIQIRSREMHERAEFGVAAHWHYKAGAKKGSQPDAEQERWLRELLEILHEASDFDEFLENSKLNMYADQVFCFSPKGRLIQLPAGATPVDFAYAVHTDLGDTCVGAKVNGRAAPLHTPLKNGDQIEVLTSSEQTPQAIWEDFVVTGKARSAIRRTTRLLVRAEHVELGRRLLDTTFQAARRRPTEKSMLSLLEPLRLEGLDDLYHGVGTGTISSRDVLGMLYPSERARRRSRAKPKTRVATDAVPVRGLTPGVGVNFATCCHPIPGDRIVGINDAGKGIHVHAIDCGNLELYQDVPERWLDAAWTGDAAASQNYVARIEAEIANRRGMLSRTTTVIAEQDGNIANIATSRRTDDFFRMVIDIEVRDVHHLADIIGALSGEPGMSRVERVRG